ncbi:TetR/AcrR family transcriptional regulator [Neogemmobacter tilapiae]|uniref:TetR family transcriptional regulator n=1 Tax=Neogemmobacter tilapiae TaxID=875041 RepID=A0A918WK51_9RHOB|nr:TetR/AcrR family transcriptional regulator [Gemmobacter tilapiae]GHC53253.1 TetR family transcriptional regulator [Gemmobacter tilapiae]
MTETRSLIIQSAATLFYGEGLRAVSMDAVAERAGLTKRTLYYHFASKDDLIAAYLAERDNPNLALFQRWFTQGGVAGLFAELERAARRKDWKGCGFQRAVAELANMPGHPAMTAARAHKKRVEDWLAECFAGTPDAARLAKGIALLMEGAFASALMTRDANVFALAGQTATALVRQAESPLVPLGKTGPLD